MSDDEKVVFDVGLVGPRGVGKTSLISSVFLAGQDVLAGSGVTVVADDDPTARRMANHADALAGVIQRTQFVGESLRANDSVVDFHLRLDPGVPDTGIALHIKDYPGGWLDPGRRISEQAREGWAAVHDFMLRSSVLLVPVDAPTVVEAVTPRQLRAVPLLLRLHDTMQVLRLWARGRALAPESPALVIFVPVKCETYLRDADDFGGARGADRSAELYEQFRVAYADCIRAVRDEAPHAQLLYLPVDTLGCVDRVYVTWPPDEDTGVRCEPHFRVVNDGKRHIRGVDDLLTALCRTLVEARRKAEQEHERGLAERHHAAQSYAQRDRGLVGSFFRTADKLIGDRIGRDELIRLTDPGSAFPRLGWLRIAGQLGLGRSAREQQTADRLGEERLRSLGALDNLQAVVEGLAKRDYSERVRRL
ncbi:hypothetical protein ACIPSA_14355 [Streptomyces sp. NPDC086549]|uniref:hypothetical protein n=1 Tax=Streptomyces sp. NPDC086549 TaxID=3365752 RepID=UPI0038009D08